MQDSGYHIGHDELEQALVVLDCAINNHRLWFNNLHTSMLCKQPFAEDILNHAAHRHCKFGQWYYSDASQSIRSLKEYDEIESIHHYMHDKARKLAQLVIDEQPIPVDEYEEFLDKQHRLIELLSQMHDTLIEYQHCFDTLTGALNRKSIALLLDRAYENMQRYMQTYSLAMIDIDYFKKVNDQYGHLVGDKVLRRVSQFLRETLRRSDSVGRYGGEEFLIMLPETDLDRAAEIIEEIRKHIMNMTMQVDNHEIRIILSAGVAQGRSQDEDEWVAVKRADVALYEAKGSGRNRVIKST